MTIGRADKRDMPLIPVATSGRSLVWHSLAEAIWASGHEAALTGRTHERTRPRTVLCQTALNPRGRPHTVLLLLSQIWWYPKPSRPRKSPGRTRGGGRGEGVLR